VIADHIRSRGGHEFTGPQDVHDTLTGMHEIISALQETLSRWGGQLDEAGVHPVYGETVRGAAGHMSGVAGTLEAVTAGGIMRGPGG
jgi:hypothetical protein